jgi:prevent-host-death family protein
MKIIPLTEAKARLSALLERLIHMRETIVITKRKKPVAVIVPYDEWVRLHPGTQGGLASVAGILADYDKEIGEMVRVIYRSRRKSKGRKVRF